MSCCWNCEKKNACGKLYTDGEQQYCEDKEKAATEAVEDHSGHAH